MKKILLIINKVNIYFPINKTVSMTNLVCLWYLSGKYILISIIKTQIVDI